MASRAMFISSHDLSALVLVRVAAGTIGVAFAVFLGQRVELAHAYVRVADECGEIAESDIIECSRPPSGEIALPRVTAAEDSGSR